MSAVAFDAIELAAGGFAELHEEVNFPMLCQRTQLVERSIGFQIGLDDCIKSTIRYRHDGRGSYQTHVTDNGIKLYEVGDIVSLMGKGVSVYPRCLVDEGVEELFALVSLGIAIAIEHLGT